MNREKAILKKKVKRGSKTLEREYAQFLQTTCNMGHYEDIQIDRREGWKYQSTHGTNGDDYYARVYVDDKGKISKDSYSREYNKKLEEKDSKGNDEKPDKNGKGNKGNEEKEEKNEGCLTKILKAPFRLLWWLIKFILKNALVILTFGIANGWFDDNKK